MERENKKALALVALFIAVSVAAFVFMGWVSNSITEDDLYPDQVHLYWKNIPCRVVDTKDGITYSLHVANKDYNVERTFRLWGSSAEEYKNLKPGDVIWCKLYSWVIEGTGEVESRTLGLIEYD